MGSEKQSVVAKLGCKYPTLMLQEGVALHRNQQ
jgi:hypothetical protein